MKIAVITDTHFGVRNDAPAFLDNARTFLEDVFFPTIDDLQIRTVLHLGDLTDRRKYINFNTARFVRERFIEPLMEREVDFHLTLGNHDVYFREMTSVNSIEELYHSMGDLHYDRFGWYKDAITLEFGGLPILLVPWICRENREQVLREVERTPAQVCFGHVELQGFEFYRGIISHEGLDRKTFGKFDLCGFGHYHTRSSDGGIRYLGAAGEYIWSDHNDNRGFHIFDTETRELSFIRNPHTMFQKVFYDDREVENVAGVLDRVDFDSMRDKVLKIVVKGKNNPFWFETFMSKIEAAEPHDFQTVEDHFNQDLVVDDDTVQEAEDTLTIFNKAVDAMPEVDQSGLRTVLHDLYHDAISIGGECS